MTVAQGTHGRRRAGPGETFWQYRNFEAGDLSALIDWRRSAGSSHLFVREREWEAAHTVWIWIDLSPSLHFRSRLSQTSKAERAIVLALALATLLSEAGERVGIPNLMEPKARHNTAAVVMETLARSLSSFEGLPNCKNRLSRHSEMVIFSDFLEPEPTLATVFNKFAVQGVRGHLMQILDPAEESLPYQGRVEFIDAESGARYVAERAETLRASTGKSLPRTRRPLRSTPQRWRGRPSSITPTIQPSRRSFLSTCIFPGLKKPIAPRASSRAKRPQGPGCHDAGPIGFSHLYRALDTCGAGGLADHMVAAALDAAPARVGHLSADLAPSWAQGARKNADTKPMVAYGPSYAGRRRGDRRIGRSFH